MNTRLGGHFGHTVPVSDNEISTEITQKVALPLWVKLQQADAQQEFDVLLTLTREPTAEEVQRLQQWGLNISEFHRRQPDRMLPGVISRLNLEKHLLQSELIRYIEGVFHKPVPA